MDTYRRRHSLKPFRGEKQAEKARSNQVELCVWKGIHRRYDTARRRHQVLSGEELGPRTLRALQKRWKLTDKTKENQVDAYGCFLETVPLSARYERIWENYYNVGQLLTCPETDFSRYLQHKVNSEVFGKRRCLKYPPGHKGKKPWTTTIQEPY